MRDQIRRVPADELYSEVDEAWERITDDRDFLGVNATRSADTSRWQVTIAVAEFVREEPLESELRQRIAAALADVHGVARVDEDDREAWLVTGTPSGEALIRAAAQVVDDIGPRARAQIDDF
jgi:hypothetical protein